MIKSEEKLECKKEYAAPQMEVLDLELQGMPRCNSGGDVECDPGECGPEG